MIDFSSTFKMALVSLKVNKMRSILTSLGIIIGVSAVIIMLAVGQGASVKIQKDMSSMGSNLLMVSSASVTSGGVRMGRGTKPTLTLKDSKAIEKNCPSSSDCSTIFKRSKTNNIRKSKLVYKYCRHHQRIYENKGLEHKPRTKPDGRRYFKHVKGCNHRKYCFK